MGTFVEQYTVVILMGLGLFLVSAATVLVAAIVVKLLMLLDN